VCLAISQLQKELENLENLDSAVSYVDLIMDYDKTFSGEKNNIPPSSQEVKEYLEFYQPPVEHEYVTEVMRNNEGITTEIRFVQLPLTPDQQDRGVAGFITPGYEQAQISLRIKDVSSAKLKALFDRITEKCSHYLKDKAGFYLTGRARLWAVTSEILVKNEILNFLLALFFIDIIMMIQFRSVKTGLIALLPNVLPIMVIFALMGLYDIALNTVTGIIACVAIGMSVDDTIHYIHSFVSFNKKGHTPEEALVKSLQFKGSSMIFTTIVIITGFAVLIVSDFVPTRQFGLFISGVFFMALVFDLVLTPALLIMFVKPSEGVKK
jgi:predicted RND superfamily exporter protein